MPVTTDDGRVYYYHRVRGPFYILCTWNPMSARMFVLAFLCVCGCVVVQLTRAVRWTKPEGGLSQLLEEKRLQHERDTMERQAERVAALTAAEEERKQVCEAVPACHGVCSFEAVPFMFSSSSLRLPPRCPALSVTQ